jgi:molybdate transport system substrate-binding protein
MVLAAVAATAVLGCASVRAAEITLIAPGGIRAAIDQMIPDFERHTGHKVNATYGSGGRTQAQVIRGEPFDVPVVQLPLEPVLAPAT